MATYKVKRGDTLSGIAAQYGMTTTQLYNQNKSTIGSNPDLIYAGQSLNVGGGNSSVTPAKSGSTTTTTASSSVGRNTDMVSETDKMMKQQQQALSDMQTKREGMYAESKEQYNQAQDLAADRQIANYEREQEKMQQDVEGQQRANYVGYRKYVDRYGAEAEDLQQLGLRNSGFAETSRTRVFNQYQKGVTDMYTKLQDIKADFTVKMQDALANADINKANYIIQENQMKMQDIQKDYTINAELQKLRLAMVEAQRAYEYQKWQDERMYQFNKEQFEHKQAMDRLQAEYEKQRLAYQKAANQISQNEVDYLARLQGNEILGGTSMSSSSSSKSVIPSNAAVYKVEPLGGGQFLNFYKWQEGNTSKVQGVVESRPGDTLPAPLGATAPRY